MAPAATSPAAPLVLASSSVYRRELLARFGIPFEALSPDIDEAPLPGEGARALVLRLAAAKAQAVAAQRPGALVIGSDQAAAFEGRILGKPATAQRAVAQLREFGGRRVDFFTGLALLDAASGRIRTHVDVTRAHFRAASDAALRRYVEVDRPLDCAGGIKFERCGALLLHAVETEDPSAAIGLPLIKLGELLRAEGVDPLQMA